MLAKKIIAGAILTFALLLSSKASANVLARGTLYDGATPYRYTVRSYSRWPYFYIQVIVNDNTFVQLVGMNLQGNTMNMRWTRFESYGVDTNTYWRAYPDRVPMKRWKATRAGGLQVDMSNAPRPRFYTAVCNGRWRTTHLHSQIIGYTSSRPYLTHFTPVRFVPSSIGSVGNSGSTCRLMDVFPGGVTWKGPTGR